MLGEMYHHTLRGKHLFVMLPPLIGRGVKRCFCLTSVCLSVAYIGPKSRTERPRKTKIGTRDSDTTFKVKGQGHQAALVGCTGRSTWAYSKGDISICVHDVYRVTTYRPGRGHIVAAARLQLDSDGFVTSAALAEACALLCAILVDRYAVDFPADTKYVLRTLVTKFPTFVCTDMF